MNSEEAKKAMNVLLRTAQENGYPVQSYSGRGMFGKVCPSFSLEHPALLIPAIAALMVQSFALGEETVDEVLDLFEQAQWDDLGRGVIVYFPTVTWLDEWNDLTDQEEGN